MKKLLFAAAVICAVSLPVLAGKAKAPKGQTLAAGRYTAKVAALTCSGCGPSVEKALKSLPGIESAAVDSEKSTVEFAVKAGAALSVKDLQKALRASAAEMGMGADYSLSKIQSLEKKPG